MSSRALKVFVMVYTSIHVNPLPDTLPSSLVLVTIAVAVDWVSVSWKMLSSTSTPPPVALIDEFRIVGDDEE